MSSRTSCSEEWARWWRSCKRCSRQRWIQRRPGSKGSDVLWIYPLAFFGIDETKLKSLWSNSMCRARVSWCSLGEDQAIQWNHGFWEYLLAVFTGACCCKHRHYVVATTWSAIPSNASARMSASLNSMSTEILCQSLPIFCALFQLKA